MMLFYLVLPVWSLILDLLTYSTLDNTLFDVLAQEWSPKDMDLLQSVLHAKMSHNRVMVSWKGFKSFNDTLHTLSSLPRHQIGPLH